MEKIVEQGLLYDFYGELLTEHQKKIYEDVVYNDLSLAEIAENAGISRQGVRDVIVRAEAAMQAMEDRTGIIRRFESQRSRAEKILAAADELKAVNQDRYRDAKLAELADQISAEASALRE